MADLNQTLGEPLLHGMVLRTRYGRQARAALFLLIGLVFVVRMCPTHFTRNGVGQHLSLQELVVAAEAANAEMEIVKHEAIDEDKPIIATLKKIEDTYQANQLAYEKEVQELRMKHMEKQQEVLKERCAALTKAEIGKKKAGPMTGTPACKGFWCQAMQNQDELPIEEWDVPVLEYLKDVRFHDIVENGTVNGVELSFDFAENPYFFNEKLSKVYKVGLEVPWAIEKEVKKIECSTIDWKPGMNITVGKTRKKKRIRATDSRKTMMTKQMVIEEPRPSFFRSFFLNMELGKPLPEHSELLLDEDEEEDVVKNEESMLEELMERDYEVGMAIRTKLIPCATRWFTSEAAATEDDEEEMKKDINFAVEKALHEANLTSLLEAANGTGGVMNLTGFPIILEGTDVTDGTDEP